MTTTSLRRRVLSLTAFAAGGFLLTVVVTWSCSLFAPVEHLIIEQMLVIQTMTSRELDAEWMGERGAAGWWCPAIEDETSSGVGVTRIALVGTPYRVGDGPPDPIDYGDATVMIHMAPIPPLGHEWSCGWPWAALQGAELCLPDAAPVRTGLLDVEHLTGGRVAADRARLPLRPRWRGLLANSVLFALALWMLIAGPRAFLRMRRRHHGRCPKCAYPVGTGAVCSECGAAGHAPGRVPWHRVVVVGFAALALSVAVALVCAARDPEPTMVVDGAFERRPARAGPAWYWPLAAWEPQMGTIRHAGAFGLDVEGRMIDSHPVSARMAPFVTVTSAGWPWRCLSGRQIGMDQPAPAYGGLAVGSAPFAETVFPDRRLIPLTLIWPGVITNTIFYALAITLVLTIVSRWCGLRGSAPATPPGS